MAVMGAKEGDKRFQIDETDPSFDIRSSSSFLRELSCFLRETKKIFTQNQSLVFLREPKGIDFFKLNSRMQPRPITTK